MKSQNRRRRSLQHVSSVNGEMLHDSRLLKKSVLKLRGLTLILSSHAQLSISLGVIIGITLSLFMFSAYFSSRVSLNTTLLDLPIGGLNVAEAERVITSAWREEILITISSDNQAWTVSPFELGLYLNAEQTIQSAQDIGFGSI